MFLGGRSFGCPENAGAAGTYYDAVPRRLFVSNDNLPTNTDTLLLEFPKPQLWTNVYIRDNAKASVPLFWSRVQVTKEVLSCLPVWFTWLLAILGDCVYFCWVGFIQVLILSNCIG